MHPSNRRKQLRPLRWTKDGDEFLEENPTMDSDGRVDLFTETYLAENYPLDHYNGPYYLSFLSNWPVDPTWENYNASHSLEPIPDAAWSGQIPQSDSNLSKTSFGRHTYVASQSYWRYKDNASDQGSALSEGTATDSSKFDILVGDSITGSYVMSTAEGFGHYEGLMAYGNRSILPSGELFRIFHYT